MKTAWPDSRRLVFRFAARYWNGDCFYGADICLSSFHRSSTDNFQHSQILHPSPHRESVKCEPDWLFRGVPHTRIHDDSAVADKHPSCRIAFCVYVYQAGKLWLPTGYHLAWNFLQGDVFGMNVSGRAQLSAFSTAMGTSELLTGGGAGPEGGLLVTFVRLLGALYVRYVIKTPNEPHRTMDNDLPLKRN